MELLNILCGEQEKERENKISDLAFDYMMKYEVDISPVTVNTGHFNEWEEHWSYYRNVNEEGIKIRF